MNGARRDQHGQASIETVVLLPALALVLLVVWQAVLAGWALVAVESASRAGARAVLVGRAARPAALAALPQTMRGHAVVREVAGRLAVTVRIPSVVPGFAPTVSASAATVRQ